ncbi:hypothetical protein QC764_401160 [Podospora pseudoanserina]|uniref:Uncharacterized protein n=1 Tax=Podospora pseudoanserina TaxID=2609844 RepID=A0ABR0I9H1_9PEZI|nr:hypothetical protein QC764_401160 [Podospora pseudoanserina]
MLALENFKTDTIENVFQRCILITGTTAAAIDHILLKAESRRGRPDQPAQPWPVSNGHFKALALLTPGLNTISVISGNDGDDKIELRIRYLPLTKTPPLHLAILIAKDSPLSIDCPPVKFGALSSTHSSLDAAIAKFRVTALMWQALVPEEMQKADPGRRSFCLEEERGVDTLTRDQVQNSFTSPKEAMGLVPRVHLVRASRTVAEIRAMDGPQLEDAFVEALKICGGPFVARNKPVVAGLILDSHFDTKRKRVLGHAARGRYDPDGLSLAMFGSHLTYAWPRFMDEIPDCLLDTKPSGDSVDGRSCSPLWQTCAVGQRDFFYQALSAFGAKTEHSRRVDDIAEWPMAFLGSCHGQKHAGCQRLSDRAWDVSVYGHLRDLLFLRASRPHFRVPGDKGTLFCLDPPVIEISGTFEKAVVTISSTTGIKHFSTEQGPWPSASFVKCSPGLWKAVLDKEFIARSVHKTWGIKVLAGNGLETEVQNIWAYLHPVTFFTLPGRRGITIEKKSVGPRGGAPVSGSTGWTAMLKKKDSDGKVVRATKLALHVGDALDGAMLYYSDGTFVTCGQPGKIPGGHQRRCIGLRKGVEIKCVAVTRMETTRWPLIGLRVWMGDGRGMGALNARLHGGKNTEFLVPGKGRRIVGFFGRHGGVGGLCSEFGIITAPEGVRLPEEVYDETKWEVVDGEEQMGDDRKREAEKEGEDGGRRAKRRKAEDSMVLESNTMKLDNGRDSSSDEEGENDVADDADFGYDDFWRSNAFKELYEGKGYQDKGGGYGLMRSLQDLDRATSGMGALGGGLMGLLLLAGRS